MFSKCTATITMILLLIALPLRSKTLLVANKLSLSVSFIDDETAKEVKTLSIGQAEDETPHEVAVSPNGKWAMVSHYGKVTFNPLKFEFDNLRHAGSALTLIDVTHGSIARRIELPHASSPHGIQFLSDTQALVTAEGIQSLLLVDFADVINYQVSFFPIPGRGAHIVALDAKHEFAYVANKDSGSVVKFDMRQFEPIKEQKIGKHAEGIALTGDGASLMVTDRLSNTVTFLNAKTLAIETQLKTESGPIRITLYDHGKAALITNSLAGTAQRVALAERNIAAGFKTTDTFSKATGKWCESIFGLLKVPVNMLVRDDQQTAYIANSYAGNISLVNIVTGDILKTFTAGIEPDGMAMSAIDVTLTKAPERRHERDNNHVLLREDIF